jgi:voltage-gated potassium channel
VALLKRRLFLIAVLLLSLLAVGTTGFIVVAGYTPFEAFYMTVMTITTVGYYEVQPLTEAGRTFNIAFMLSGVVTMFFIVGSITQIVLDLELANFFGKRRTRKMIDKLTSHYIVCGFGRVGRGASAELSRAGRPFVIIDRDENTVERAQKMGYTAVQADCSRDETLREVGIARARGLIAALSSDADNLFLILSAKTLNPMLNVATRVSEDESQDKMRRAGADAVLLPYTMTGYRLAQAILRPHVFEFLDIATSIQSMGLNVGIEQVKISPDSAVASRSIRDLRLRRDMGVIVLAIRRNDGRMEFNPAAETTIGGGDYLIVMGDAEAVRNLETLVAEVRV